MKKINLINILFTLIVILQSNSYSNLTDADFKHLDDDHMISKVFSTNLSLEHKVLSGTANDKALYIKYWVNALGKLLHFIDLNKHDSGFTSAIDLSHPIQNEVFKRYCATVNQWQLAHQDPLHYKNLNIEFPLNISVNVHDLCTHFSSLINFSQLTKNIEIIYYAASYGIRELIARVCYATGDLKKAFYLTFSPIFFNTKIIWFAIDQQDLNDTDGMLDVCLQSYDYEKSKFDLRIFNNYAYHTNYLYADQFEVLKKLATLSSSPFQVLLQGKAPVVGSSYWKDAPLQVAPPVFDELEQLKNNPQGNLIIDPNSSYQKNDKLPPVDPKDIRWKLIAQFNQLFSEIQNNPNLLKNLGSPENKKEKNTKPDKEKGRDPKSDKEKCIVS